MNESFLVNVVEANLILILTATLYRFSYEQHTYFGWNRVYLIVGVLCALVIPFLDFQILPFYTPSDIFLDKTLNLANWTNNTGSIVVKQWADVATQNLSFSISDLLLSVYFIGFTYHLRKLLTGLLQIKRLRISSQLLEINDAYRVYSQSNFPSFSFLQTIFLNQEVEQLTNAEKEMVLMHERIHIVQKHTYDILLLEAFGVLFWFNPAVGYLKNALKLVHEYLVDEVIANKTRDIYAYGTLLVKLSQSKVALSLSHTFSNHQIFR